MDVKSQQAQSAAPAAPAATGMAVVGKSGKKICCSCPDTKQARDECIVTHGEDKCSQYINAHKACLRLEGFTVA